MATGTVKWFEQALLKIGNKLYTLSTDSLKMGIVTTAVVPTKATANPHWGGTGTTNFATSQVATATAYVGPITLAGVSWTTVAGAQVLKFNDISIAQDAAGFTNGAYGIIYDDTDANKRCLGFVEISAAGTASLVSNPLTLSWSSVSQVVLSILQS